MAMLSIPTEEMMKRLRAECDNYLNRPHTYMIHESLLKSPLVKDVLDSKANLIIIKDKKNAPSTR